MLFNSYVFPIFFVIVFALYVRLRLRPQNVLLLVASYVFYGWWDWRFLSLLAISTVVDYTVAQRIEATTDQRRRRGLLLVSLCTNLGILGFFKYFNFFADSLVELFALLGLAVDPPTLHIILPVGISFYTFQTMAYTIDVYRGKETATRDFLAFAVYVAFFPQLVAGPIERSTHLLPQIQQQRRITRPMIDSGLQLVLVGYFKKVFIADGVAPLVNQCFAHPDRHDGLFLLLGVYLFAIQIYGDFSGYTDIARGVARLLGIDLRLNFQQPYVSTNITEFWRRWHMSLSSWLRDYLYIPLGGNRKGPRRTYVNLMLTMLLGGLWHGAGWNFVVWGGLHGSYLAIHKVMVGERRIGMTRAPLTLGQFGRWLLPAAATFHLVCLSWIFFRAADISAAWAYLEGIARLGTGGLEEILPVVLVYGTFIWLVDWSSWRHDSEVPFRPGWSAVTRGLVYGTMVILISFLGASNAQPFIYFQF